MDDTKIRSSEIPMIVYVHGAGGSYETWWKARQEWDAWLREWFVDQGWAILECDGGPTPPEPPNPPGSGPSNWGGPVGRQSYKEALDWVVTQLDVGPMVSYSFSMGGLINYWLASQSPYADRIQGMIVSCGTTDLASRYHLAFNHIWGVEPVDVLDKPQFVQKSAGYNPMDFPLADWEGRRVLQIYGETDLGLPYAMQGGPWVDKYGAVLGTLEVVPQPNVGHWTARPAYDAIRAFAPLVAADYIPPYSPPTSNVAGASWIAESVHLVGAGRELLPVSVIA